MIKQLQQIYYRLLGINNDFKKLFFANEYKALSKSKSGTKVLWLALILLLTFLSLGFAIGGYKYLQKRMDNPFTTWVDWPVGLGYEQKVGEIRKYFSEDENKAEFNLNGVSIYHITRFPFLSNTKDVGVYYMKGRVFDSEGEKALIHDVLGPADKNVLSGVSLNSAEETIPFEENKCGIVVTKNMLQTLGYEDVSDVKKLLVFEEIDDVESSIYLDIISVVNELPNNVDFLCTRSLYNARLEPYNITGFIDISNRYNNFKFASDVLEMEAIEENFKNSHPDVALLDIEEEEIEITKGKKTTKYIVNLENHYTPKERQIFINNLGKSLKKNKGEGIFFQKITEYSCMEKEAVDNPHYVAFNFDGLNKVKPFDAFMQEKYGVEISMSQIESANNFAVVSNLTIFFSISLLIFSIISIIFYINSLLRAHLEKIKMNLGTFKAFGLSDRELKNSYLKIISVFVGNAICLSFLLSCIIGGIVYYATGVQFIHLFNMPILVAVLILFVTSYFICRKTIVDILNNTPGDLIYNRV